MSTGAAKRTGEESDSPRAVVAVPGLDVWSGRRVDRHAVPVLLSPEQVCEIVPGLTERTLVEMRARWKVGVRGRKGGPQPIHFTKKAIGYLDTDVAEWVRVCREEPM